MAPSFQPGQPAAACRAEQVYDLHFHTVHSHSLDQIEVTAPLKGKPSHLSLINVRSLWMSGGDVIRITIRDFCFAYFHANRAADGKD